MTKKQMLTDLIFCHYKSQEGTYHHQNGKCARFPIFHLQTKYYNIFKQNILSAHNEKKCTLPNFIQ